MKILFSCPILDIRYEWFIAFTEVWEQLKNHQVEKYMPYRKSVHIADTIIARKAIEGNFDYILRMDDDVWDIPPNAVEKLINADKEFISCVMYASGFPYQRCAFIKKDKNESLIEIADKNTHGLKEATGMGIIPVDMSAFPFVLIKTSVFKKIPEPWFEHSERVPPDNYFCQKMLDSGIQPYVDMDLQVNHRGITFWNRKQKFLSECEAYITLGKFDKDNRLYDSYIQVRDELLEQYQKKKLFVL